MRPQHNSDPKDHKKSAHHSTEKRKKEFNSLALSKGTESLIRSTDCVRRATAAKKTAARFPLSALIASFLHINIFLSSFPPSPASAARSAQRKKINGKRQKGRIIERKSVGQIVLNANNSITCINKINFHDAHFPLEHRNRQDAIPQILSKCLS